MCVYYDNLIKKTLGDVEGIKFIAECEYISTLKTHKEYVRYEIKDQSPILLGYTFDTILDDYFLNIEILQDILKINAYKIIHVKTEYSQYNPCATYIEIIDGDIIKNYFIHPSMRIFACIYYKKYNDGIVIEYIWKDKLFSGKSSFDVIKRHYLKMYKFVDTGSFVSNYNGNLNGTLIYYSNEHGNKLSVILKTGEEIDINDKEQFWNNTERFIDYRIRIYRNDEKDLMPDFYSNYTKPIVDKEYEDINNILDNEETNKTLSETLLIENIIADDQISGYNSYIKIETSDIVKKYILNKQNIIESVFYYKKVNNGIILEYIWSRDIQLGLNFYFITSHFLKTYKFVDTGKILMDRCRDIRNYLISYGIDNKNKVSIITNTNEELNIEDSKELIEINGNYSVRIYNKNDNKIKK